MNIEQKSDLETRGSVSPLGVDDPSRQNGMMTRVWGPPGWFFLHCLTFGYPDVVDDDRRKAYGTFFRALGDVLPCKYCRNSYNEYMNELPIEKSLGSRDEIIEWFYNMHNKVNDKLNVPECDRPSLREVHERYEAYRAKCVQSSKEVPDSKVLGCLIPKNGKKRTCSVRVHTGPKEHITEVALIVVATLLVVLVVQTLSKKRFILRI